jgi:cell division cycle protein 20 (cofactor of APC complex)
VVKFDGSNNFGMWQCEVMDALLAQGLEDTVELEAKPANVEEKVWIRKNRLACGVIRSCLTQDIKYNVMKESSAKKIWDTLEGKYLTKTIENMLHLKRRLYSFKLKKGTSMQDHMNAYTKLLADLVNVDVDIEEEDKALILLSSLPDEEYETFVLTLINGKASLKYNEVTGALVSYELRRRDKESSGNASGEALTARGSQTGRDIMIDLVRS